MHRQDRVAENQCARGGVLPSIRPEKMAADKTVAEHVANRRGHDSIGRRLSRLPLCGTDAHRLVLERGDAVSSERVMFREIHRTPQKISLVRRRLQPGLPHRGGVALGGGDDRPTWTGILLLGLLGIATRAGDKGTLVYVREPDDGAPTREIGAVVE